VREVEPAADRRPASVALELSTDRQLSHLSPPRLVEPGTALVSRYVGLARDDIERMVKDAEAHAEEDRRRRDEAEVRNQADTLVYQTEKLLKEQGDKISGDEKSAVEDKLGDLKAALGGSDTDAIRNATDALMAASQSFTQKLYEAASQEGTGTSAGATAGGGGGGGDQPSDDDVVDAEIVDDEEGSSS